MGKGKGKGKGKPPPPSAPLAKKEGKAPKGQSVKPVVVWADAASCSQVLPSFPPCSADEQLRRLFRCLLSRTGLPQHADAGLFSPLPPSPHARQALASILSHTPPATPLFKQSPLALSKALKTASELDGIRKASRG